MIHGEGQFAMMKTLILMFATFDIIGKQDDELLGGSHNISLILQNVIHMH